METDIFNLTKDSAPALIHFGHGSTQQWLMVRVDDPQDPQGAQKEIEPIGLAMVNYGSSSKTT